MSLLTKRPLSLLLAMGLIVAAAASLHAEPMTFTVEPDEGSQVTFISTAQLESFEGHTDRIAGTFTFDPVQPDSGVAGKIEVDMTSLTTGISQRDGHMRENHLETATYPRASFVPKKIVDSSFKMMPDNEAVEFMLEGDFTLHGVTHTIQPMVTATWHPDSKSIDVIAKWTVRLEDYNIARPQFLVLKLAQEQKIEVRFTAKAS